MRINSLKNTKAEVLEYIYFEFPDLNVPPLKIFSLHDFEKDPDSIYETCLDFFDCDSVAIRSSSQIEDSQSSSMAGRFDSVLNVPLHDKEKFFASILVVVKGLKELNHSLEDQFFVQEMLSDISVSGVVFTHDLSSNAPYYVVNYDDKSGLTDTVTSGKGLSSNHIIYIYRSKEIFLKSSRFISLLKKIKKLETIFKTQFIDVEFVISSTSEIYILQVRSLLSEIDNSYYNPNIFSKKLLELEKQFELCNHRQRGICGKNTIYGQMPDWNPAEIIGKNPKELSSSLFSKIITEKAWSEARTKLGYRKVSYPLMSMFAGQPYIDCRLSFNSFLPSDLPDIIAEKLVDEWVLILSENPSLHDKIEFEIAITCFNFNIENNISKKCQTLTTSEKKIFKEKLISQFISFFNKGNCSSLSLAISKSNLLSSFNDSFKDKSIHSLKTRISQCIENGTIPFSIVARHGFIAKSLLDSLLELGVLTKERIDNFYYSINSISFDFLTDLNKLNLKVISYETFIAKYGHLRPGTYDINTDRYDQMDSKRFYNSEIAPLKTHTFSLTSSESKKIDILLKNFGIYNLNADTFINYCSLATRNREYIKFVYSRTLSDCLDVISRWGKENGFDNEILSYLPISHFLNIDDFTNEQKKNDYKKNKFNFSINSKVKLPPIILDQSCAYIAPHQVSQPNFITGNVVDGKPLILSNDDDTIDNLKFSESIIFIENADPGFDWIFGYNFKGLITKFGGANSHMAIRCNELKIPAAIGCGELKFNSLIERTFITLDCASKKIN